MKLPLWLDWIVAGCLALLIVADAALIVRAREVSNRAQTLLASALFRSANDRTVLPPPTGRSATAGYLGEVPGGKSYLIRYASTTCPYCKEDVEWERLALLLESAKHLVVVVLPRPGEEYSPELLSPKSAIQAAFVSMDWTKQFRITMTPTVMIIGRTGTLLWHRQGVLEPGDVDAALRVIETSNAGR